MNVFEKCCRIRSVLVARAAEVMIYDNWSDEYAAKTLRNIPADLRDGIPDLFGVQPSELTDDECTSLGFGRWSEGNPMRLIPLWLLPFLADDVASTCIDGSSVMRRVDMDSDNRGGCLAYGIVPADKAVA